MQTDLWLTDANKYDRCPLCSKLLKRGSQTCYACGFSNEAPSVWIDPTVRSYQHVMPPHTTRDLTPDPQAASPIWQYESPDFEAAGSLPMLSLLAPEVPTQPQPPVPNRATTRRLPNPDIDEIDTIPPRTGSEAPPPVPGREQRALVIAPQKAPAETGSRSWTAGAATGSASAQLIARPGRTRPAQRVDLFHPLDRTRWWLLRPGRLEFILWLGGTLLLIGVTCLLLLVFAFSFQWFAPAAPASPLASSVDGNNAQQHSLLPRSNTPTLILPDTNPMTPGQSFQLSGYGFKSSIKIAFYFDGKLSLFNQSHQPAWVRTDARGTFQTTLWLGTGPAYMQHGQHFIAVRDASGTPLTAITIRLDPGSNTNTSTSTIASSSPVPTVTPGVVNTATPTTPIPGSPQGTPVNRPPVTVTPTLTPTHTTPTVTPTVKTSPTVTPTAKTSPTPVPSPARGTPTAVVSPTAGHTALGNALNDSGVPPASRLASVSPLVWIMVACYLLSMLCLGAAGIMHRRHSKIVM